ncbi:MAG: SDR family NAD(P)-dependent oxidoreductase [Bdellovibrionia bacterium]
MKSLVLRTLLRRGLQSTPLVGVAGFLLGVRARERQISFRGRVVVIMGGSRGLGLILARQFASEGARLALCSRNADELNRARYELESRGADVLVQTCDVAKKNEVQDFMDRVVSTFGRIDVLINNASIIQVGPAAEMNEFDIREAMDVNFWGGVHATYAALPQMVKQRGGRIVNVTSIGGVVAVPHLLPYSSAKFAAVGFSQGLRSEVSQYGIMVTTVIPGLMRTGSFLNALFKGKASSEAGWFSVSASLPVLSMNANRAARKIVEAARHGQAVVTLGMPAIIARYVSAILPGFTAEALSYVNRILPSTVSSKERFFRSRQKPEPGYLHQKRTIARSGILKLGEKAAERNNEKTG